MVMRRRDVLKWAGTATVTAGVSGVAAGAAHAGRRRGRDVDCDVCVIGGGSAGTYAALRLRDLGHSVCVVERKSRLGGHAETYVDPATQTPIDYGVVVFENVDLVNRYFDRLGVNAMPLGGGGPQLPPAYVDLSTGQQLDYAPPGQADFVDALIKYRTLIATQFPYLDDGFVLPDTVPEDLLLPFTDYVEKYELQALFPTLFQYGQGLGDVAGSPTLYVLKNFSAAVVDSILGTGFLAVPAGTATIYDAAALELGDSVSYGSEVVHVERGCHGRRAVRVTISTPEGYRRISCHKLVVAFPPNPRGLRSLDLDRSERRLLQRFRPNHYSAAVVDVEGLPPGVGIQNVGDGTLYDLPDFPGLYGIGPTPVPGVYNVKFGSSRLLSPRRVRREIVGSFDRMRRAGTFDVELTGFRAFSDHSPFELMVSPRDIARGFYDELGRLQGHRDTFYTGAAFQTNDSSLIWSFTETLLPKITA